MGERVIMSREILFKAKRIDNGEWVEGYYQKRFDLDRSEQHLIFWSKSYTVWEYAEIDPDTLCQYTGLTDKDGKKIWENDILRGHGNDDDLAKVVFGEFDVIDVETHEKVDRVIGWHTKVIETDVLSKCEPFCLPMPLTDFYIKRCEYEVVKNAFDNPELLEVER